MKYHFIWLLFEKIHRKCILDYDSPISSYMYAQKLLANQINFTFTERHYMSVLSRNVHMDTINLFLQIYEKLLIIQLIDYLHISELILKLYVFIDNRQYLLVLTHLQQMVMTHRERYTCKIYIISIHVGATVASACICTYINIYIE